VIFAVFLEILGHLRGQFARRLKDQRARHPGAAAAMRQNVDHRQHEARRLAGPGLGDADQIAHHQHRGDRLRLDRRGRVVARLGYGSQQLVRQAEIGKFHSGSGIICGDRRDALTRPRPCASWTVLSRNSHKKGVGAPLWRVTLDKLHRCSYIEATYRSSHHEC
jgi:hypothetical protein